MHEEKESRTPHVFMGVLIIAVLIALGWQQSSGSINLSAVSWGVVAVAAGIAVACIIVVVALFFVLLLVLRDRRSERNAWKQNAMLQVYDRQQERNATQQAQHDATAAIVQVVQLSAAERVYLYNQVSDGMRLLVNRRTGEKHLVYPNGATIDAGRLLASGQITDEALNYIEQVQAQLPAPTAP